LLREKALMAAPKIEKEKLMKPITNKTNVTSEDIARELDMSTSAVIHDLRRFVFYSNAKKCI
jgi:hypothetical protein